MMRYGEALDTLAQLEGVPEAEAAGWVSAKLDQPFNPDPNPSPKPIPNPKRPTNPFQTSTATLQHCTPTLPHCNTKLAMFRSNTLIAALARTR